MWESVTLTLRECSVKAASCEGGSGCLGWTTSPEAGEAGGLEFLLRISIFSQRVSLTAGKPSVSGIPTKQRLRIPTMNHWWDFIYGRWLTGSPALHAFLLFSPSRCFAGKQWAVSDPWVQTAGTAPSAAPTRGKEPAGGSSSTRFCPAEEVRVSEPQQLPQFWVFLFVCGFSQILSQMWKVE